MTTPSARRPASTVAAAMARHPAQSADGDGPQTVFHLEPLERAILLSIRYVAAGKGLATISALIKAQLDQSDVAEIAKGTHDTARCLDDPDGPHIMVHRVPCKRVSADEMTVLKLLAATQAADDLSAETYGACLVSASQVDALLNSARTLAARLTEAGRTFAVAFAAPRLVWLPAAE